MDSKNNVTWQVSLSNGETFFEGKGQFEEIAGIDSSWQRLIKYIAVNKLSITSLSLVTEDGRTFNLPSAGKNPKFKPFVDAEKPLDYELHRTISREHTVVNNQITKTENVDWFTYIEAIYPNYKLQLWVDENNTRNSWVLVVNNNEK